MDRLVELGAALVFKLIPDKILDAVQRRREADLARIKEDLAAVETREAGRRP